MSEFQQRAAAVAVAKMLGGKHFSVSDLRAIAKTMGMESALAGRDMAALEALHCVDWADMGAELAQMTREKCLELLGLPPNTVEMVRPEPEAATKAEPKESRPRLAFWRAG